MVALILTQINAIFLDYAKALDKLPQTAEPVSRNFKLDYRIAKRMVYKFKSSDNFAVSEWLKIYSFTTLLC